MKKEINDDKKINARNYFKFSNNTFFSGTDYNKDILNLK